MKKTGTKQLLFEMMEKINPDFNPIEEVGTQIAPDVANANKLTTTTAKHANALIDTPQEFQQGFAAWFQTTGFDPQKKPLSVGQAQTMVRNAMNALGYK